MTVETLDSSALNEVATALAKLPPLGPWVADAACARLGEHGADVFTATEGVLDGDELDAAVRVCRHCPVRQSAPATPPARTCGACGAASGMGTDAAGRWCGETQPEGAQAEAARVPCATAVLRRSAGRAAASSLTDWK